MTTVIYSYFSDNFGHVNSDNNQTFQLCALKMREILVIVIYKGGFGDMPPGKFLKLKLKCHLLHFQRRLMYL